MWMVRYLGSPFDILRATKKWEENEWEKWDEMNDESRNYLIVLYKQ